MLLHFLREFVFRCTILDSQERIWPWERNRTRCYSTSLEFVYRCIVLAGWERNWPWERNRTRSYSISFENLCSDALFSAHENEYDLESGIGPDATPFPLRIRVPMHFSRRMRPNMTLKAEKSKCYSTSFAICVPIHCSRRTITNMTLTATGRVTHFRAILADGTHTGNVKNTCLIIYRPPLVAIC